MSLTCNCPGWHPRPALEHGRDCPVRLAFYGGDPAWPRPGPHVRDGVVYAWGEPGTWVPDWDATVERQSAGGGA